MNNTTKILAAVGIGLVAGAVAGLLMAPRKGADTRRLIAKKRDDAVDAVKDTIQEGRRRINSLRKGLNEKAEAMNHRMEEVFE